MAVPRPVVDRSRRGPSGRSRAPKGAAAVVLRLVVGPGCSVSTARCRGVAWVVDLSRDGTAVRALAAPVGLMLFARHAVMLAPGMEARRAPQMEQAAAEARALLRDTAGS